MLNRVTVTGADDSVKPEDLVPLQAAFPWVEWGILVGTRAQAPRFPSFDWCAHFVDVAKKHGLRVSTHLCGAPVRAVCEEGKGAAGVVEAVRPGLYDVSARIQLNFHGRYHRLHPEFAAAVRGTKQFIFQDDAANDEAIARWCGDKAVDCVPLFDLSGGAGILPGHWPAPKGRYQGYAGGLSPENVAAQLYLIGPAANGVNYWIDCETRVRSEDDALFDLALVRAFLKAAAPFVGK